MVVEICCSIASFSQSACPDSVDTVLTASVERTEAVTLVEYNEQRGPLCCESCTTQDVWDETFEITIAKRDGRRTDTGEAVHVIAVVGREPHEARSRSRAEIIDEHTVSHRTTTRVGENNVRTTRRTVINVAEGYEWVMLGSIRLMNCQVTATRHPLVLHVALPSQTSRLKPINEIRPAERPGTARRAAVIRRSPYHRDIVSLAIVSHTEILRADSVAVSQTGHVGSTHGRKTWGWAVTTDIIDSMIFHNHNHDMIKICAGRRGSLRRGNGWLCYVRDAGDAQAQRQR